MSTKSSVASPRCPASPTTQSDVQRKRMRDLHHICSAFEVTDRDNTCSIYAVTLPGPLNSSNYSKGKWTVELVIPDDYPSSAPIIAFEDEIYHPNLCFETGEVCMCLIDEKWESDFTLLGIFEGMLPLLLEELNPSHPMNSHAKNTFNKNRAEFERLAELHSGLKKDDSDSEKKQ